MESVSINLAAQSTYFKLKTSSSKDYGIFIDGNSIEFIKPFFLKKDEKGRNTIEVTIFKDDCIRALGNIMCSLPLYTSKNGVPLQQGNPVSVYKELSTLISSFFGESESKALTGLYFTILQDRWYLWGTEGKKAFFELRKFFVANHTTIEFIKPDSGNLQLRFNTHIVAEHKEDFKPLEVRESQNNRVEIDSLEVSSSISSYLRAIRTKPFLLLAGISGTGKSRIVRKLAQATVTEKLQQNYTPKFKSSDRWNLHSPANFELIQVKPNWHNSMDVVGYLSNIPSPHYVFTPFINFIIKAWLNPEVPFFLCVDEMNLAPVEEYFAEFLSAIESRGFENGEYITDPIIPPFNTFNYEDENGTEVKIGDLMINSLLSNFKPSDVDTSKGKLVTHLKEKGLTLPKNLIVIGTVNMDETTFSFSRKVLDRAMSIEMNKVDYSSFLNDATDDDIKAVVNTFENGDITDNEGNVITLNQLLVNRHVEAKEIIEELGGNIDDSDARFVIEYLERINALLDSTPFKLGYRVANEALIYLRSSQEFGLANRESAMDHFTLMKILSRIEGDETKLKITDSEHDRRRLDLCNINEDSATQHGALTLLTVLRAIIVDSLGEFVTSPSSASYEASGEESDTPDQTTPSKEYRASIKKIDSMISQLDRDHFVSYWS